MGERKSLFKYVFGPDNGESLFERVFGPSEPMPFNKGWPLPPSPHHTPPRGGSRVSPPRVAFCGNCSRLEATFNRALGALRDQVAGYGKLEDELRARISDQAQMIAVLGHENEQLKKNNPPGGGLTTI